ncbi:MAG: AAA family ATPase [Promethearchaeota archaeon]
MAYRKSFEILFDAFALFEDRCLISDRSLLWPEKNIWTLENLNELQGRLYKTDPGKDYSFQEKIEIQLKGASSEIWGLFTDLYYVYALPSRSLKYSSKRKFIDWATNYSNYPLPSDDDTIWNPLRSGFCNTGYHYYMKIGQIYLLILFSIDIKSRENIKEVLADQKTFETILDDMVEQAKEHEMVSAIDMRHSILYLKFPEKYERIISTSAKKDIIKYYSRELSLQVPDNIDEALNQIRKKILENWDEEKPFDFYDYGREWDPNKQPLPKIKPPDEEIEKLDYQENEILHAFNFTKNLILSGPPGTGKTYLAKKISNRLVESHIQKIPSKKSKEIRIAEQLTFSDLIALDFYQTNDKRLSVPEIEAHSLIQARFLIKPVEHPRQSIWGTLQIHTAPTSETVNIARRTEPYLFDKDHNSKWFLTDEGRNYVKQNLMDIFKELDATTIYKHNPEDFIRTITFHQSYAYEDFIEGIRPSIGEEESGELTYEIKPGVFLEICNIAKSDPNNDYVLIIDEINRGNISKIFGELITLVEDDKREMEVELPYSKRNFSVPKNLFLIGTLNTADRSIALMDVALRRRFAFIEMMPRLDLIKDAVVSSSEIDLNLSDLLGKLNEFIRDEIDRNHQIGHSYFMKVADTDPEDRLSFLNFVWNYQIFPLLMEYFYSQNDKLLSFLNPFKDEGHEVYFEDMVKEGEDLLFALNTICHTDENPN